MCPSFCNDDKFFEQFITSCPGWHTREDVAVRRLMGTRDYEMKYIKIFSNARTWLFFFMNALPVLVRNTPSILWPHYFY